MFQKLKPFLADDAVFYSLLLILVAVASFGLGRKSTANYSLSAPQNTEKPAIQVQTNQFQPQTASIGGATETKSGAVIASKSGTKYHLPTCPGAKQIKESNKISFGSIQEAEGAGYTAAANCSF